MTDDNIKEHPYRALLQEAAREREVVNSPEGQVLQEAIFSAVRTYSEFLDRHDLIFDDDRLKARALVVTLDYGIDPGTIDIALKDCAIDRVYRNGVNPHPEGHGPADI